MYAKVITLVASLLFLQPALAAKKDLKCETGPVQRMFGQALWNLYACDDSKSMVAVPADASNGGTGYFLITPNAEKTGLVVVGEGLDGGGKFKSVFDELNKMSPTDLWIAISIARATDVAKSRSGQ
ncbi:MAG: hypothetical protein RSP_28870 [Rhodanobacter sp.]